MTYVFEMTTDQEIRDTDLHESWNPTTRYEWEEVRRGGLNIPAEATIVVIAHGDGNEIGNENPGEVDISAEVFLVYIQNCMAGNFQPGSIYLSTCGTGIAEFSANVRIIAEQNEIWSQTSIFGHHDAVSCRVPPATDMSWTEQ